MSFDIANVFNSFPWPTIRDALVEVPGYHRRVLDGYLSDRCHTSTEMADVRSPMKCDVPQVLS